MDKKYMKKKNTIIDKTVTKRYLFCKEYLWSTGASVSTNASFRTWSPVSSITDMIWLESVMVFKRLISPTAEPSSSFDASAS